MSIKIAIRGFFDGASDPVTLPAKEAGKKDFVSQTLLVTIPGYVDQWQVKVGKDEVFAIQVIGDNIGKHDLMNKFKPKDKVICTCWLNCNEVVKDGKSSFFYNVTLHEIELFDQEKKQ